MPAGPARTPRRLPARIAGLRRLPQHEVERIVLRFVDLDPGTAAQVLEPPIRQCSVGGKRAHVVVDVAIRAAVGGPALDQPLHHRDDRIDVVRRARLRVRLQHAECAAVLVHVLGEAPREHVEVLTVLVRAGDDLVVDVSDIAHVRHPVAQAAQIADDHVERHQHPCVAKMAVVVDGHAAHVHPHVPGLDRTECLFRSCQRVVDRQHGRRPNPWGLATRSRFCSTSIVLMDAPHLRVPTARASEVAGLAMLAVPAAMPGRSPSPGRELPAPRCALRQPAEPQPLVAASWPGPTSPISPPVSISIEGEEDGPPLTLDRPARATTSEEGARCSRSRPSISGPGREIRAGPSPHRDRAPTACPRRA